MTFQLTNGTDVDTISISESILINTVVVEGGNDTVGGDIVQIARLLSQLLHVHELQNATENEFEANKNLTDNVLETTNHLFKSTIGWEEISENQTRYDSSSNLLTVSDSVGYLLFKQSRVVLHKEYEALLDHNEYSFKGSKLDMSAKLWQNQQGRPADSYCYIFDNSEICVPKSAFNDVIKNESVIEVVVQYDIGVESLLFPNSIPSNADEIFTRDDVEEVDRRSHTYLRSYDNIFSNEVFTSSGYRYGNGDQGNNTLNSYMIGLSVNNGTPDMSISSNDPVRITFRHEPMQVRCLLFRWLINKPLTSGGYYNY